jgi:hypothetical protein
MSEWDDEVAELYALEPGEFVAARNALAKRMKTAGEKDGAAAVAKLGRPTIVAWALNQAAREDPERIAELIDAAGRVARAQTDLMAGGDAAELRSATTAQRSAAGEVAHAAVTRAGANHADTVRHTLDAALADPALTERLRSGTLDETLDAPAGFGFGFDTESAASPRPKAPPSSSRAEVKAHITADDATEKAAADARAVVARLERELSTAAKTMGTTRAALDVAERELGHAEEALAAARQKVEAAGEERDRAAEAFASSQEEQERLNALLDDARRLLEELEAGPG